MILVAAALLLAGQEIRAVEESPALLRVTAPGRFETTFTKRKGFGATWFDLQNDPGKKRDLAPVLDENGFFWIKIGKPGTDGSWYSNPPEEMTLLESGPVRARVRLRGAHMRYGNTDAKAAWKELRFDQVYTVYPDGSVFIAYALEQEEPVPYHHFLVITKSNGAWGPKGTGDVKIAGQAGAAKPTSKSPSSFTLQWSDGPTTFTDILMVAQKGAFGAAYWNEGYLDKDIRCSFDLGAAWPGKTLPAGKQRVSFLMRFATDINSSDAGSMHADDYRSPDRLEATQGKPVVDDEGDRDGDGYNEEEGCHVLSASPEGVTVQIRGKARPRVNPAFKIKGWTGDAPRKLVLGGRTIESGAGMNAAVREGTLLVQILSVVKEDAALAIPR